MKLPLSSDDKMRLARIACSLFCKHHNPPTGSGVVVAGFGANDLFPAISAFKTDGVINDTLVYYNLETTKITYEHSAAIKAFAQYDMVHTFIEGIGLDYKTVLEEILTNLLRVKYPERIVTEIDGISDNDRKHLQTSLSEIGAELVKDVMRN